MVITSRSSYVDYAKSVLLNHLFSKGSSNAECGQSLSFTLVSAVNVVIHPHGPSTRCVSGLYPEDHLVTDGAPSLLVGDTSHLD